MAMTSVLIIDDDKDFCDMVARLLAREEFVVEKCSQSDEGLQRALSQDFDVILLDVMMPRLDGLDVLRALRAKSGVHVIMLTAKGDEIDRVVGLELGADDYLPKPFNSRELIARIRAVLRRSRAGVRTASGTAVVRVGDVLLDPSARTVLRHDKQIDLTTAEFDLLQVLLVEAGKIVAREQLAKVLGRNLGVFDRAIDMHISNLRRKLGPSNDGTERIRTVRNAGYLYAKPRSSREK